MKPRLRANEVERTDMLRRALAVLLAGAIVGLPAAVHAKPAHAILVTHISAKLGWQKVRLLPGGKGSLRFTANGTWVFNPSQPPVDGDGAAKLPTAGRTNYTFSGPQGREGQLIGKIGNGAPFVAGAHGVHDIGQREIGRLYLMINDDYQHSAGRGQADNSGRLRVRIDYRRR
jgi:hypothetical protein